MGIDFNVSFNGFKNQFHISCEFTVVQLGLLKNYSVKILGQAIDQMRHDGRFAGVAIVGANLVFIKVASHVTMLVDRFFSYVFGPQENWTEKGISFHSCVLVLTGTSTIIGLNALLYTNLKPPFSPFTATSISVVSCTTYTIYRLWCVSKKELEG